MQVVRSLFGTLKFVVVWAAVLGVLGLAMTGAVTLLADNSAEPAADSAADGDGSAETWGRGSGVNETAVERLVVQKMNAERRAAGRDALDRDADLRRPARAHAADMHAREFYGHENPDGEQPWDRAACQATENIHRGVVSADLRGWGTDETFDTTTTQGMADYIVAGWVNSEQGHYEAMVDRQHSSTGVGVAIADGEFFAVAMFC